MAAANSEDVVAARPTNPEEVEADPQDGDHAYCEGDHAYAY
jgi:hypothetical protein